MIKQFLFISLIIIPRYLLSQQGGFDTFTFKNDTIKSKIVLCDPQEQTSLFRLFNLIIDSNFLIIDSMKCMLNTDNSYYYIFILSNKIQENDVHIADCDEKYNMRLLIILLSKDNKFDLPIINENIILNRTDYQSEPFRELVCINSGFKIGFYFGTRIRYYYDFYFKFGGNKSVFLYKSIS